MIVYHGSGSAEIFKQFDYYKIGTNGTAEGFGFYFTDSKQIAEGYAQKGNLYTIDFVGKKSLSSSEKTITKLQLTKYLKRLHELSEFLSNWGDVSFEGYNKILKEATDSLYDTNDNDVDIIGSIINAYGDKEEPLDQLYKILGYDSIQLASPWGLVSHNIYIALVHDAYEIISVEKR